MGIGPMDEEIKKGLKRVARDTEIKVTESILRWKYKREGKRVPDASKIGQHSEMIADQAHSIIAKRGKNIWSPPFPIKG